MRSSPTLCISPWKHRIKSPLLETFFLKPCFWNPTFFQPLLHLFQLPPSKYLWTLPNMNKNIFLAHFHKICWANFRGTGPILQYMEHCCTTHYFFFLQSQDCAIFKSAFKTTQHGKTKSVLPYKYHSISYSPFSVLAFVFWWLWYITAPNHIAEYGQVLNLNYNKTTTKTS